MGGTQGEFRGKHGENEGESNGRTRRMRIKRYIVRDKEGVGIQ
jgi:hypothetical protein